MKGFLLSLFSIFISLSTFSQVFDPVSWTYSQKKVNDNTVDLQFTATIDEGWHIYSSNSPEDASYFGTVVEFKKSDSYQLVGKIKEPKPIDDYDEILKESYSYHESKVTFTQRVKVLSEKDFKVEGELVYMACNESGCLPPEYKDVSWKIKGIVKTDVQETTSESTEGKTTEGIASDVEPETLEIDYAIDVDSAVSDTAGTDIEVASLGDDEAETKSFWGIFLICFGAGLAALLTPCVFPMIPMTVSYFTKTSKTRAKGISNAILYGLAIVLIYGALSFPFHIFDSISPNILNEVSTNVYLNLFFFLVFMVFAISFFGAFEITLPNSWINKADKASDKGGLIGIFFMALTLVLVSFSCTGPALGGLLGSVLSTDGGAMALTAGMLGFGVGLGLPFGLFAAFPGWLNSLPKSGGWLNSVKVVFGFVELALAFKFLSNADLVVQTGILQREVFLAIWIAVFAALTLYLFGAFKLPHDSPLQHLSVFRMIFAVFTLMFTVYLIPGLWGAPLKIISGFPPPSFYSESPGGFGTTSPIMSGVAGEIPEGADPEHCPHGLNCFHEFEVGLDYAKEVGKPVLLDFTGWACVNCRKMEEQVWSDPRVLEKLREDFVLISLYVDERKKLPEDEQYVSELTGKKIKTVGNKWSDFQVQHYKSNSQPQYIIINHNSMKPLVKPASYDPDIEKFIDWMDRGITAFEAGE